MSSPPPTGPSHGRFPNLENGEDTRKTLHGYCKAVGVVARWHNGDFQGTIMPYSEVVDNEQAADRLLSYFGAVYRIASPLLLV